MFSKSAVASVVGVVMFAAGSIVGVPTATADNPHQQNDCSAQNAQIAQLQSDLAVARFRASWLHQRVDRQQNRIGIQRFRIHQQQVRIQRLLNRLHNR